MPRIEADHIVDVDPWTAFAVSQTTGDTRLRWDPFIRSQHHLDGATIAGTGVRSETRSKHGLRMVSEYTSFHPPDRVGMKMVEGPWFFDRFGGGWIFKRLDDGRTLSTWRYTFSIRPSFLSRIGDPIGIRMLQRDIDQRIAAFAAGCIDPEVLAVGRAMASRWQDELA
ncbi:MAG: SRPBCC family protein [Actinomycetota bacterium]